MIPGIPFADNGNPEKIKDTFYLIIMAFQVLEMLKNLFTIQGSFTKAAIAPPNAIAPKVVRHHRNQRRGDGGQALFPPSSYPVLKVHIKIKGILQSRVLVLFELCKGPCSVRIIKRIF
jgi:hypothetical protein